MTRLEYGHISVQNHGRLCNVRLNRDTDNIRSICIATLNGMKLANHRNPKHKSYLQSQRTR